MEQFNRDVRILFLFVIVILTGEGRAKFSLSTLVGAFTASGIMAGMKSKHDPSPPSKPPLNPTVRKFPPRSPFSSHCHARWLNRKSARESPRALQRVTPWLSSLGKKPTAHPQLFQHYYRVLYCFTHLRVEGKICGNLWILFHNYFGLLIQTFKVIQYFFVLIFFNKLKFVHSEISFGLCEYIYLNVW